MSLSIYIIMYSKKNGAGAVVSMIIPIDFVEELHTFKSNEVINDILPDSWDKKFKKIKKRKEKRNKSQYGVYRSFSTSLT